MFDTQCSLLFVISLFILEVIFSWIVEINWLKFTFFLVIFIADDLQFLRDVSKNLSECKFNYVKIILLSDFTDGQISGG